MPTNDPTRLDDDYDNEDLFGDLQPTIVPDNYSSGSRLERRQNAPALPVNEIASNDVEEMDWEEENRQDPLIMDLLRVWMNERLAPDILNQRGEIIQSVLDRIREQAKLVNRLRSDIDTVEDEHFQIVLVQTEMERMRFILRSYMRTRIHKIEKFSHYILSDPEIQTRLSAIELKYAESYAALINAQLDTSILNALPAWIRKEGPNWQGPSTVSKPDKSASLFVHALADCPHIPLPDGRSVDIKKGSIVLVRYSSIENNLQRGEVELV